MDSAVDLCFDDWADLQRCRFITSRQERGVKDFVLSCAMDGQLLPGGWEKVYSSAIAANGPGLAILTGLSYL